MSKWIQKPDSHYELVVIGAGPAGLAAAEAAYNQGLRKILLVERDKEVGGILNQCIHNGFGLHVFKEELTGPEYAGRFRELVEATSAEILCDTMVLELTGDRALHLINPHGYHLVHADAIVLAMGCRERTRGAIGLPGTRPAGVFTAGAAQRYLNMEGHLVGRRVLILGSGDIGLIMARRMTWEGAKVLACVELMPYSGGLNRNIVQCLQDFDIPLYLSHTIIDIRGRNRVEGCTIAKVDATGTPIPGTEIDFDVDTILLSVGLIPENELSNQAGITIDPRTRGPRVNESMETSIPGVFACGNVVHVHDLVDFVTEESRRAGTSAAKFVLAGAQGGVSVQGGAQTPASPGSEGAEGQASEHTVTFETDANFGYTVPQYVRPSHVEKRLSVFFRVRRVFKNPTIIHVWSGDTEITRFRKQHLAPGEMESLNLTREHLEEAGDTLRFTIEELPEAKPVAKKEEA